LNKFMTITATLLASLTLGATLPTVNASAKTYKTTPKSLRGYYIGKGDLVQFSAHQVILGAPQAGQLPQKIKSIHRTGRTYRIHAISEMDKEAITIKFQKRSHHHLHFYNHKKVFLFSSNVTKVSHHTYRSYNGNPFHGLPKGVK